MCDCRMQGGSTFNVRRENLRVGSTYVFFFLFLSLFSHYRHWRPRGRPRRDGALRQRSGIGEAWLVRDDVPSDDMKTSPAWTGRRSRRWPRSTPRPRAKGSRGRASLEFLGTGRSVQGQEAAWRIPRTGKSGTQGHQMEILGTSGSETKDDPRFCPVLADRQQKPPV